jgi:hypothetical protein
MWFNRPLSPQAVQYAADDVRYLLPVAYSLLQQLPGALLSLSSLQMQLAQQREGAMQLQQRLLPGYSPLLQQQQQQQVGQSNGAGAAAGLQQLPGLTSVQFELQLSTDVPGWHQGMYLVYRNEQQGAAADGDRQATAAAVALAGTSGGAALLARRTAADGAQVQQQQQQQLGGMQGCGQLQVDEAVQSMVQLLPDRWVR